MSFKNVMSIKQKKKRFRLIFMPEARRKLQGVFAVMMGAIN